MENELNSETNQATIAEEQPTQTLRSLAAELYELHSDIDAAIEPMVQAVLKDVALVTDAIREACRYYLTTAQSNARTQAWRSHTNGHSPDKAERQAAAKEQMG